MFLSIDGHQEFNPNGEHFVAKQDDGGRNHLLARENWAEVFYFDDL